MTQQAGILVGNQNDNSGIDTREGLPAAFIITTGHPVACRAQSVWISTYAAKCVAVLPVVQRLGIGQNTSVLGGHMDGSPAQVCETCIRIAVVDVIFLGIGHRHGEIISRAIIAQQGGG